MPKYKRIPITAAKEIAKKYDKQEVIILARDYNYDLVHTTSYGINKKACNQAAITLGHIQKFLGLN